MPALATSTSTGPWVASTSLKAASTAAESVTSHTTPLSPSGVPEPRWVTVTLCPSAASRRAMARPMLRFPPVTRTERETNAGLAPSRQGCAVSVMTVNLSPHPDRIEIGTPDPLSRAAAD